MMDFALEAAFWLCLAGLVAAVVYGALHPLTCGQCGCPLDDNETLGGSCYWCIHYPDRGKQD